MIPFLFYIHEGQYYPMNRYEIRHFDVFLEFILKKYQYQIGLSIPNGPERYKL